MGTPIPAQENLVFQNVRVLYDPPTDREPASG